MKTGMGLPNSVRNVRAETIPRWAAQAEAAGFSSVGTTGRFTYPGVMDLAALAVAAGATSTVGLISTVLVAPAWPAALLAKHVAGINEMSGGRLTLGIGVGSRPDDFMVEGLGTEGRGARLERDIAVYRDIWSGEPSDGTDGPAVPSGTRQVPLLFGGYSAKTFSRMARFGDGYIGSVTPERVAAAFESARSAWRDAGRAGAPRLVAVTYFGFEEYADEARANTLDYYRSAGADIAKRAADSMATSDHAIRATRDAYEAAGADELIFFPAVDRIDQVARLADLVL
ncbi:LLM class flavin-dependent oxidoreductase [Streptomyces liangshanensis]|uniref:LLM class flavin-dependent oxidoreductase n=1 Tax=Streptomyces liangshanensis TaxID=2717324 RepID=A0A6G9GT56_9ACTN|nr:LLM class flavin-dependent oxidoreductase [Streptomyces liangshanensis]QIQ01256.1 LLM class flavin-dependent oxidoreductase [Streptomyces liangshanensis]